MSSDFHTFKDPEFFEVWFQLALVNGNLERSNEKLLRTLRRFHVALIECVPLLQPDYAFERRDLLKVLREKGFPNGQ